MTDYYKTALNLLITMLKDSGYDNWINWLSEDIRLWESEHTTEHHLRAYGGMGSFNDIVIGNNDTIGLWKDKVFSIVQALVYSLAKGIIKTASLEESFYSNEPTEISGWRCRNCGNASINERNIDIYLSAFFIPKFFVKYLKQDTIEEILDIEKMINSSEVLQKKQNVKYLVEANGIAFSAINDWLWACPNCGSSDVCTYRWNITKDDLSLQEADDNLPINKS
jgi:hypothetical protein